MRRLALRYCRDPSEAGDLVQNTFLRALEARDQVLRDPCRWLARVLYHLFIDRCRKQARLPVHESLNDRNSLALCDCEQVDARPAWSRATVEDVRAELEELDSIYRVVFEKHVFEHRSYDDIAAELGINRITVGTRLKRARCQLRALLVKRLGEETDP